MRKTLSHSLLGTALCLLSYASFGQSEPPTLDGYVTAVAVDGSFNVNSIHILCDSNTTSLNTYTHIQLRTCSGRSLGDHLQICGKRDKKKNTLLARSIEWTSITIGKKVSGTALIDHVWNSERFRADGYVMRTDAKTLLAWDEPLAVHSPPATSQWVEYQGAITEDGSLLLTKAVFQDPPVTDNEKRFRQKMEFDPFKNTEDNKQSGFSKMMLGKNYKRLIPSKDAALQQRVSRIGNSLIPATQTSMAAGEPRKYDFRFTAVEDKLSIVPFPNGIILVGEQVANKLNDQQLAALIAYAIADVLQREEYLINGTLKTLGATQLAAIAGSFFVPGIDLATWGGTSLAAHNINLTLSEQAGRNGMVLLHDAGYDPKQMALIFWFDEDQGKLKGTPSPLVEYLLTVAANQWRPGSALLAKP